MNTLAFADVTAEQTSGASTIASTAQQLAVSFGVASASLTAALFIPDHAHAAAAQMIRGLHLALQVLGVWTMVSTLVFLALRADDGEAISSHRPEIPAG